MASASPHDISPVRAAAHLDVDEAAVLGALSGDVGEDVTELRVILRWGEGRRGSVARTSARLTS